jgi:hypothetical protein
MYFWDVYVLQGNSSVGKVYAANRADAMKKALAKWPNTAYVMEYTD